MASDPKPTKKLLSRCGERVVFARLASSYEGAYMLGGNVLREKGVKKDGSDVEAMSLHPWGLVVVPDRGPHKGTRLIIPGMHVAFVAVAEEEG